MVVLALTAGCGGSSAAEKECDDNFEASCAGRLEPPAEQPDIRGHLSAAGPRYVRIDDGAGAYEAAAIRISDETGILRGRPGAYAQAEVADLTKGTEVEVWFTGPVAESHPVQATAGVLVIAD